ncbi:MAG: hypothetical protein QGH39_13070 [Candidatus Thermoplasmatota archaeon]|nr:hypothetical protein [Candidatus Thermoplasmatota archaeon]MDP7266480.1 hypothetical protein [Candidatus Thermoplasmatota archaeon]
MKWASSALADLTPLRLSQTSLLQDNTGICFPFTSAGTLAEETANQ